MAEYIERDAAIAKIREEGVYGSGYSNEEREDNVVDMIESIPAADVRPVVTCIECKHSCDMPGGLRCCYGTCVDCYVESEFFCADGEREES